MPSSYLPPNSFLTNKIITYEALDVLENSNEILIDINSEYSSKFEFGGAVLGATLDIRKAPRYRGRLGQAMQLEAIVETSVPLTLSFQRGVDTHVSSAELVMDIDNYRRRVLEPQIARLSNMADSDVANLAQGLNNVVGTPGVTPSSLTTYGLAKVKLDNQAASTTGRRFYLNPTADFTLMDSLKGLFHTGREIAAQYDSGSMTKSGTLGATWGMDQNIYVHTVGTLGASTPVTSGVPAEGASSITTTGWSSGTLNAGDVISFVSTSTPVNTINPMSYQTTGQTAQFVVTATTSDAAGTMVIPFAPAMYSSGQQQNVTNRPANGTPVYVFDTAAASFATISGKQSPQNLAVQRDFGTLAMVDLPLPGGTDRAFRASSRKSGKSIRVIRDYVALTDQWVQRLDWLYGTAVLRPELGVRIAG